MSALHDVSETQAESGDGVANQPRIALDEETYWLRIARAGKLVLTK